MEYRKKLKMRLYTYIIYTIIGAAMLCIGALGLSNNDVVYSFGAVLALIGVIRIVQYVITIKNEDSAQKREIAETDERNVTISTKAKSFAVTVYLILASLSVIVLELLDMLETAQVVSYMIIAFLGIYLICYFIVRGKY